MRKAAFILVVCVIALMAVPAGAGQDGAATTERPKGFVAPIKIVTSPAVHNRVAELVDETFTEGTIPPTGWSHESATANTWVVYHPGLDDNNTASVTYLAADQDEWLITPALNLASLSAPTAYYWEAGDIGTWGCGGAYYDMEVWLSTAGGTSSDLLAGTMLTSFCSDPPATGYVWTQRVVDLSAYTAATSAWIGFRYVGNDGNSHYLDKIWIGEPAGGPIVAIDPASKNFGFVSAGATSADTTFWLINYGDAAVVITGTSIVGADAADFTLTDATTYPATIDPGTAMSVDVSFGTAGSTLGAKTAVLRFTDGVTDYDADLSGEVAVITTAPDPVDECATAPQITEQFCGLSGFDTSAFTVAGDDPSTTCGSTTTPTQSDTAWYTFTPNADGEVTISTCGAAYDTVLQLWSGTCGGGLVGVACSDDFCGAQSQVTANVTGGVQYYVEIGAYGSGNGGSLEFTFNSTATVPVELQELSID